MALGAEAVRKKLKVHRKRDDGLNIWICHVEGPRKKANLKGYLLETPALLFNIVPADNPFLKIVNA